MDCDSARQAIRAQEDSEALRAHVASCNLCAALQTTGRIQAGPADWASIAASVAAEPARPPQMWSRLGVWSIAMLLSLALVSAVGTGLPASNFSLKPRLVTGIMMLAGTLLTALGLAWHFRPLHKPAVARAHRYGFVAAAVAVGVGIAFIPFPELSSQSSGSGAVALAARCVAFGCVLASPLLVWLKLGERRTQPSLNTAVLGLTSAALVAVLGLELHCPNPDLMHRLMGHASLPIAVAVGWVLYALTHR